MTLDIPREKWDRQVIILTQIFLNDTDSTFQQVAISNLDAVSTPLLVVNFLRQKQTKNQDIGRVFYENGHTQSHSHRKSMMRTSFLERKPQVAKHLSRAKLIVSWAYSANRHIGNLRIDLAGKSRSR